jgi:hypothetical protein
LLFLTKGLFTLAKFKALLLTKTPLSAAIAVLTLSPWSAGQQLRLNVFGVVLPKAPRQLQLLLLLLLILPTTVLKLCQCKDSLKL